MSSNLDLPSTPEQERQDVVYNTVTYLIDSGHLRMTRPFHVPPSTEYVGIVPIPGRAVSTLLATKTGAKILAEMGVKVEKPAAGSSDATKLEQYKVGRNVHVVDNRSLATALSGIDPLSTAHSEAQQGSGLTLLMDIAEYIQMADAWVEPKEGGLKKIHHLPESRRGERHPYKRPAVNPEASKPLFDGFVGRSLRGDVKVER